MMSLAELRRAVAILEREVVGHRVDRVAAPEARRVVLSLHSPGRGEAHVLACAEPTSARLSLVPEWPPGARRAPAFAQVLRARLVGARLVAASLLGGDRQALLRFEGGEGRHALLLSFLGPRTNLYLLDAEERIVAALRSLDETRRDLALGEPWRGPASATPPAGEDRFTSLPDRDFFAALEAAERERESRSDEEALRQRLERGLRRAAASLAKKRELLAADAAAGAEAETLRSQGELLKSVIARVRPGDREARARDFASGEEVVIPLDPALAPRANLDGLFRRARKAEKRAARALREQGELEVRSEALAALQNDFEAIRGDDAGAQLHAFAERPDVERILVRFAREAPASGASEAASAEPEKRRVWRVGKQDLAGKLVPRVYRSHDGLEIWVGRSDEGNDLLSTRLARGNDLFFHLDASPGSHVVLRTGGRNDPPSESLLDACELAVHFSKARNATNAEVLVAPIKNVSKPRGAKPGLVYVRGGRAVRLRRDPKRLERLLASQEGAD
jgi:predicted ribosome quality control (RQC) complex YloA/Tae2 family protein